MKKWVKKFYPYSIIPILLCVGLFVIPYFFVSIHLVGETELEIEYQGSYIEQGATSSLFQKNLVVSIHGEVNTSKVGVQVVTYEVKNYLGAIKSKKRKVNVVDKTPPILVLKGDPTITLPLESTYQEPGYTMIDNVEGNISKNVTVQSNVDTKKIGTYEIIYTGEDLSKNKVSLKRIVKVIPKEVTYQSSWTNIDNTARTWWSGNKKDHTRPATGAGATEEEIKKYNAYYMGPDTKTIYLTFDEGSNDTYIDEIVDVLNKNQVKATFFFCGNFVKENPELMKKLVEHGHSVGNHTYHHNSMYDYANPTNFSKFVSEIQEVESIFYEITGKEMDKIYREPRGDWSYRDLEIVKEMGYKSFFWSADYLDWSGDVTKKFALNSYMDRYHNGAIYLIHPKNKGNYEAMDEFIQKIKELGYQFGLVKDINY